jgi:hypothetical protein
LAEGLEVVAVKREFDDLVVDVDVAADNVARFPAGQLAGLALGHGVVPHQLAAPAPQHHQHIITPPLEITSTP